MSDDSREAQLYDIRPEEHQHLTFAASYRLLVDLYRDVQRAHMIISTGGHTKPENADATRLPNRVAKIVDALRERDRPVEMLLWCPECMERHIDTGEFETKLHHTHACQSCGLAWRPAIVATVGVRFLPGFRDEQ